MIPASIQTPIQRIRLSKSQYNRKKINTRRAGQITGVNLRQRIKTGIVIEKNLIPSCIEKVQIRVVVYAQ